MEQLFVAWNGFQGICGKYKQLMELTMKTENILRQELVDESVDSEGEESYASSSDIEPT